MAHDRIINERLKEHLEDLELKEPLLIVPLIGGLSNHSYVINNKYVYRSYSNKPNEAEHLILEQLEPMGLCPKTIKRWDDARLETYINFGAMTHEDFLPRLHEIVRSVEKIHLYPISIPDLTYQPLPIIVMIQERLSSLMDQLPEKVQSFANYFLELHQSIKRPLIRFRITVCHNDLHPGNILKNGKFVDFEFSGMNYEMYDWANMANESELVPNSNGNYEHKPNPLIIPFFLTYLHTTIADFTFFRNLSHLFWGLWGLVEYERRKTREAPINFDYLKYANLRFSLIL